MPRLDAAEFRCEPATDIIQLDMASRRSLQLLQLSADEQRALERIARRRTVSRQLSERARIVLACVQSRTNSQVAKRLGFSQRTIGKWRERFRMSRIAGLSDEPRSGTPRRVAKELVEDVVHRTLSTKPENATRWTSRQWRPQWVSHRARYCVFGGLTVFGDGPLVQPLGRTFVSERAQGAAAFKLPPPISPTVPGHDLHAY